MQLSQISVYPLKSSAGIQVSNSWVDELGLSFDRRFVLSDDKGQFITARTEPTLCLIQANITATGLVLTAPDMPKLVINYHQLTELYQTVFVWDDNINAQQGNTEHHQWFSRYLKRPCQLLHFGELSTRKVPDTSNRTNQLAFADGYPLLLISQASLDDLNKRCSTTITMNQFRPNLVIDNCDAFAEDTWQHIRIGEVEFELRKPCTRCIFTTINPETAIKDIHQEPITSLKTYRQAADGDLKGEILFGQNLIPLNQGQIKLTDTITIIKKKAAPTFSIPLNTTPKTVSRENKKKVSIKFDSWNKTHKGDNQQTILDQGEKAGLILPYSCRAGMCGRCKVKLVKGQVEQLSTDGLTEAEMKEDYILMCSCIPKTDVILAR
ncbi:YcbX family protein [Colwellia sp. 75C3]|uniref:YcbX family protein n=1 Tax=Colwellia sp. 75C3 TaxID=888425 RepID=UPI0018E2B423|nr:YcbX family protein [Colwellia sp. 75C3]